eukprot:2401613-Amphidinium_carterae.1
MAEISLFQLHTKATDIERCGTIADSQSPILQPHRNVNGCRKCFPMLLPGRKQFRSQWYYHPTTIQYRITTPNPETGKRYGE